jgi:hypothetical protein
MFIRESEVDYFSFLSRPHRGRGRFFIQEDCKTLLSRFVIDLCGKSYRGPDSESRLYGTPEALGGTLEIGANDDDPLRTRYLEYHVWIVRDGHEFCQSRSPNDGVVSAIEARHLEPQELSSIVLWGPEGDEHVDVP